MTTIKTFTVETAVKAINRAGGSIGTRKNDRVASIKAFWAKAENSSFFIIGRFLANVHEGKTLAEHLVNKESFTLESIVANGVTLPLAQGTVISLTSIGQWGCPACGSAHGSGVGPSSEVDAKRLAGNEFYYNPTTKRLFTISSTCWSEYVKALGATGRFKQVEAKVEAPPVVEPVKAIEPTKAPAVKK